MAGAFGLTFVVLAGAFVGLQSMARDSDRPSLTPGPTLVAVASLPAPTPFATRHPAGTPRPLTTRPPTPTRKPAASASVAPSAAASSQPTASAAPVTPGEQLTIELHGDQYELADVPSNGTITPRGDGAVTLATTRELSAQMMVTWFLPEDSLPAGAAIASLDVAVCGSGDGDFYETYGPEGSDPMEHEVEAPDPDGCWHYNGSPGFDTSVIAITRLASTLTIEKVVYTVTLAG
jgi:hypothetical protein